MLLKPQTNNATPCAIEPLGLGLGLAAGDAHYRAYVGPPEDYDLIAAMCFGLLTALGLRGRHRLLDVGCGSLRLGRLLIPYLNAGNYYGLEPNAWLVDEGLAQELGQDILPIKAPHFAFDRSSTAFGQTNFIDFALAQSIFSHCGLDFLTQHLREIHQALTPSGALLATFVTGEVDSVQSGWIYPGCVEYTPQRMAQAAQECGYEFHLLDWLHPRQQWALFAKPGFDRSWLLGRPLTWNTWLQYGPK
jgi:SAM-dependent methyltransferase